jgi:outer membrane receptor protein involved in Fe transport
MKERTIFRLLTVVGLAAIVGLALPAAAQVSTGTIEVTTNDEQKLPIPGVAVRVVSADTGAQRATVSDAMGLAIIPALPPGEYSVAVSLSGFATAQESIVIRIGQTARLAFTLKPQISETITVTAEAPMVDIYKSDTSTNIIPEQIQQLPVPDRDFQNLAFIAPGVQRERGAYRFIGDSALVGSSGNASETAIIVDGVDFTDQALGLARARFSQDAIGEFKVINNRFDTEIGSSAGGALSVVTKSGSNTVHGSVFGFYRGDSLREVGEFEEGTQDFTRYQIGFTLGGPIKRDKTHYFLSFEYIDEDNIALFRPQGAFADLSEDVPRPMSSILGLASLDHQIGMNQNLMARLVYEKFDMENFRVGGVADESSGMQFNRENWNLVAGHNWMVDDNKVNDIRFQFGQKYFEEPNNSDALTEYFTFGTTLVTGANIIGDQDMTGDYISLSDTFSWYLGGAKSSHELKFGASFTSISEDWHYPLLPQDWMWWPSDARIGVYRYDYFVGATDLKVDTDIFGIFAQDDWRLSPNFSLNLGLRYDYDTDGNNPNFDDSPLVGPRSADSDNIQPRVGFTWDIGGNGNSVFRGGAGIFTGRYLLVPSFIELQQNGTSGVWLTRLNGFYLGLPADYWLDPSDPRNTGVLLPPNITLLQDNLEAPEALQASLGFTQRLGNSGLYLDIEGIYSEGDNEFIIRDTNWSGNDNPGRPNPYYYQINMYTNEGHSKYKALMMSLNGTLSGGHIIACNVTYGDKQNIADDFSPVLTNYPSDPADIEAEWGRGRSDEQWRVALTGIFRLPANFTIAPIYRYGSGQPWNRRLGYDYNGDLRTGDRMEGVPRNSEDGPSFSTFNLRITWTLDVGNGGIDFIAEAFNLFNRVNYDVNSIDNAEFLAGPTLVNPDLPYTTNPNFGNYSATLAPREIQIGMRYTF